MGYTSVYFKILQSFDSTICRTYCRQYKLIVSLKRHILDYYHELIDPIILYVYLYKSACFLFKLKRDLVLSYLRK